jgi:hypothetical protein
VTRIVFRHLRSGGTGVHIFRNFGADLWKALKDEKRFDVSLDEIDRCIDHFEVRTKPALVRRTIKIAEPLLRKHLLIESCQISVED